MGEIKKVSYVKLFIGMLASKIKHFESCKDILSKKFGNIDLESSIIDFNFTNYYKAEMGKEIYRKFISFDKLIDPIDIKDIKLYTNQIEKTFSEKFNPPIRPINLDPGYLSLSKVCLATTKDYSHRIYIGGGIYAEVTLRYTNKSYNAWEWTYPDYLTEDYLNYFHKLRNIFKLQIK